MYRRLAPLLCATALVLSGCSRHLPTGPSAADPTGFGSIAETAARDLVDRADWPESPDPSLAQPGATAPVGPCVVRFDRQQIAAGIAHYSARVRVGPGTYDLIGIHRVVRERAPRCPIITDKSLFLVHGDYKDFVGVFLPGLYSPNLAPDFGAAVYLARNDVDVWGIDLGWTLVPRNTTEFGFMKTWNMQRQVDDLRVALGVARLVRGLTGSGLGKLDLLGYSMGATLGYAYLNDEACRPALLRHVKGYIPADFGIRTADPAFRDFICAYAQFDQERMDGGTYAYSSGFHEIAQYARTAPADDSPFAPGLTNLQFALMIGAGPGFGPPFTGHYLAGVLDADQMPTGFQFVTVDQWLDFLDSGVPFGSVAFELDQTNSIGDCKALPYDDHLSQVRVPVLNIDAGGGFGSLTDHSLDLLGSTDITRLNVSTNGDPALDFGHIDLWIGRNAEGLVWSPILAWIEAHSARPALAQAATE